jgi:hypothetical protein
MQKTSWLCSFWNGSPFNLFVNMWWSSNCRALSALPLLAACKSERNWLMDRPRFSYQLSLTNGSLFDGSISDIQCKPTFFFEPYYRYIQHYKHSSAYCKICKLSYRSLKQNFNSDISRTLRHVFFFFVRWWAWWLITFHRAFKSMLLLA